MDEKVIREHAQALCAALVAGDIDRASRSTGIAAESGEPAAGGEDEQAPA